MGKQGQECHEAERSCLVRPPRTDVPRSCLPALGSVEAYGGAAVLACVRLATRGYVSHGQAVTSMRA